MEAEPEDQEAELAGRAVDAVDRRLRVTVLGSPISGRGEVAEKRCRPTHVFVADPPQLRAHFDKAGWTKADVREYVHRRTRVHRREWAECGKGAIVGKRADQEYPALPDPDHLLVIAAGGPAGGFGAVIPPWLGPKSRAVTVAIGACVDCEI